MFEMTATLMDLTSTKYRDRCSLGEAFLRYEPFNSERE